MGNKRQRNRRKKGKQDKHRPRFVKVRAYAKRNSIALISLSLTLVTSFLIYFWAYGEPDIRIMRSSDPDTAMRILDQKIDEKQNVVFYCRFRLTVKNYSFHRGYIDKVEFVPAKINFVPEITIQHIDKSSIAWLEQKEIELLFLASAPALQLDEYQAQNEGKGIPLMVKFYDNKGNVVNLSDKGEPIEIQYTLSLKKPGNWEAPP
jgi:hypothetical protein